MPSAVKQGLSVTILSALVTMVVLGVVGLIGKETIVGHDKDIHFEGFMEANMILMAEHTSVMRDLHKVTIVLNKDVIALDKRLAKQETIVDAVLSNNLYIKKYEGAGR